MRVDAFDLDCIPSLLPVEVDPARVESGGHKTTVRGKTADLAAAT